MNLELFESNIERIPRSDFHILEMDIDDHLFTTENLFEKNKLSYDENSEISLYENQAESSKHDDKSLDDTRSTCLDDFEYIDILDDSYVSVDKDIIEVKRELEDKLSSLSISHISDENNSIDDVSMFNINIQEDDHHLKKARKKKSFNMTSPVTRDYNASENIRHLENKIKKPKTKKDNSDLTPSSINNIRNKVNAYEDTSTYVSNGPKIRNDQSNRNEVISTVKNEAISPSSINTSSIIIENPFDYCLNLLKVFYNKYWCVYNNRVFFMKFDELFKLLFIRSLNIVNTAKRKNQSLKTANIRKRAKILFNKKLINMLNLMLTVLSSSKLKNFAQIVSDDPHRKNNILLLDKPLKSILAEENSESRRTISKIFDNEILHSMLLLDHDCFQEKSILSEILKALLNASYGWLYTSFYKSDFYHEFIQFDDSIREIESFNDIAKEFVSYIKGKE